MVEVCHHGNTSRFSQMAEHPAQDRQRRMRAAARPGLQDDRRTFRLGGGDEGAHVFPPKADQAGDGITVAQRRLQHVG